MVAEITKKCKDCQIKRLDFVDKSNLVETDGRVFFTNNFICGFCTYKQHIMVDLQFGQLSVSSPVLVPSWCHDAMVP